MQRATISKFLKIRDAFLSRIFVAMTVSFYAASALAVDPSVCGCFDPDNMIGMQALNPDPVDGQFYFGVVNTESGRTSWGEALHAGTRNGGHYRVWQAARELDGLPG